VAKAAPGALKGGVWSVFGRNGPPKTKWTAGTAKDIIFSVPFLRAREGQPERGFFWQGAFAGRPRCRRRDGTQGAAIAGLLCRLLDLSEVCEADPGTFCQGL
jgi:hypothetical protein